MIGQNVWIKRQIQLDLAKSHRKSTKLPDRARDDSCPTRGNSCPTRVRLVAELVSNSCPTRVRTRGSTRPARGRLVPVSSDAEIPPRGGFAASRGGLVGRHSQTRERLVGAEPPVRYRAFSHSSQTRGLSWRARGRTRGIFPGVRGRFVAGLVPVSWRLVDEHCESSCRLVPSRRPGSGTARDGVVGASCRQPGFFWPARCGLVNAHQPTRRRLVTGSRPTRHEQLNFSYHI